MREVVINRIRKAPVLKAILNMAKQNQPYIFAPRHKLANMNLKDIKEKIEESMPGIGVIQISDEKLIIPNTYGLDGIHSTLSLYGESNCLLKHPAILYEKVDQANIFLSICDSKAPQYPGIEFLDDPISKCIMAVKPLSIRNERRFLRDVAKIHADFVFSVKAIRDFMATIVLDTVSPVSTDVPTRSLFYLSLMQSYDCPWGWNTMWNGQIDWNDIRTVWRQSKSTRLIPLIKAGGIYDTISKEVELFLNGAPGYVVAYFGLPYYSYDTCDMLGIDDIARRIYSQHRCHVLKGVKVVDSMAAPHMIALAAILKW